MNDSQDEFQDENDDDGSNYNPTQEKTKKQARKVLKPKPLISEDKKGLQVKNVYSVKDTSVRDFYKLQGKPNATNNFDDFAFWFPIHFSELDGLWDEEGQIPTELMTSIMILRNIDVALHHDYRTCTSGQLLWIKLKQEYSAKKSNSQAILLSSIAKYLPPVDMDTALQQMKKNVRLMVNAFGHEVSGANTFYSKFAK